MELMEKIIFYSWQSDLPNSTNRNFIEDALKKAVKNIGKDETIELEASIDRDTQSIPGSPNISETILNKIDSADLFVCDVSIINKKAHDLLTNSSQAEPNIKYRLAPNPNVLFELGYATKSLGLDKTIMVMNTSFGVIDSLPFDLKMRRVVTYNVSESDSDRSSEKQNLVAKLEAQIREAFYHSNKILPTLNDEDNNIFKELCEIVVDTGFSLLNEKEISPLLQNKESESSLFNLSLEILENEGLIKVTWAQKKEKALYIKVSGTGFDLYATKHIKNYFKFKKDIIDAIIANAETIKSTDFYKFTSHTISETTSCSHVIVLMVLAFLSESKLIKTVMQSNGEATTMITEIFAKLHRI